MLTDRISSDSKTTWQSGAEDTQRERAEDNLRILYSRGSWQNKNKTKTRQPNNKSVNQSRMGKARRGCRWWQWWWVGRGWREWQVYLHTGQFRLRVRSSFLHLKRSTTQPQHIRREKKKYGRKTKIFSMYLHKLKKKEEDPACFHSDA